MRDESTRRPWFAVALSSLIAAAGCALGGAGTVGKPIVEFPPAAALAAMAAQPAAAPRVETGEVPAEGWTVEAAFVARSADEAWQPQMAWDQAFASEVASTPPRPRLTRALSCVAREVGRYLLASRAAPPESLRQFMAAACGLFAPEVGFVWLSGEMAAGVDDNAALAQWRPQLRANLVKQLPAQATDGGFFFGRGAGTAVAVATFAALRARLAAQPLAPDAAGNVVVEGELLTAAEYIKGYVNQGPLGVRDCAIDPSVARPRFRAVCPVAAEDATAWIQLLYAAPRRVLSEPFVQLLVRRAPDQPLTYQPPAAGAPRPIGTSAEFADAAVAELNAVRAGGRLTPVRLARDQSVTAGQLATRYFAATITDRDPAVSERIALGLLAGWRVGGMIRDGQFISMVVPRTRDVGQWLRTTLTMPMGRSALLAPHIEEVAFGPLLLTQPEGLGAVVVGYELHHGNDHARDVQHLYQRLVTARARVAAAPVARLAGMDGLIQSELALVHTGQQGPREALNQVLHRASERFGKPMRGYIIETTSLEALEIPDEVVRQRQLFMEIGVTHYRPPGAAWAQFVILVVFADYSDGASIPAYQEARVHRARRARLALSHALAPRSADGVGADESPRKMQWIRSVAPQGQ